MAGGACIAGGAWQGACMEGKGCAWQGACVAGVAGAGVDPGFPIGGGTNPPGGGTHIHIFPKIA